MTDEQIRRELDLPYNPNEHDYEWWDSLEGQATDERLKAECRQRSRRAFKRGELRWELRDE